MTESPLEVLKRESRYLRGTLAEELGADTPGFSRDSEHLLKLHGLYQQKDRDRRKEDPPPALMVRGRIPGGRLTPEGYLAWDSLADQYGDGTLRLTTRQTVELHGVLKGDSKAVLAGLHRALLTTQGACGDLVRNVTLAPNPWKRPDLEQLEPVADLLSTHFLAKSRAYPELWLDGEKVDPVEPVEPFYGATYLPRKFKIALTASGENLVDLYTNDLAFAATYEAGRLEGFFAFAGGGMGMTHGDPTTFPRLADALGWVPADRLLPVAEAVVALHRDEGNRADRRHARLKYLVADRGAAWLKEQVEARSGVRFQTRDLPPWRTSEVLGWLPRTDGTWAYGVHTPAGRIRGPLKQALRTLVADHGLRVQISPDQDLILLGIQGSARKAVEAVLHEAGALAADPLARLSGGPQGGPPPPRPAPAGARVPGDRLRQRLRQALQRGTGPGGPSRGEIRRLGGR